MKNYLVRARINFNDVEEKDERGCDTPRKANISEWKCTKERYEYLKNHNAVELLGIDEIKEEIPVGKSVYDEKEVVKNIAEKTFELREPTIKVLEEVKPKRTRKKKVEEK